LVLVAVDAEPAGQSLQCQRAAGLLHHRGDGVPARDGMFVLALAVVVARPLRLRHQVVTRRRLGAVSSITPRILYRIRCRPRVTFDRLEGGQYIPPAPS